MGTGSHLQLRLCSAFLAWGPTVLLLQADLLEWLCALGLPQYHKQLVSSGYDSMGLVADLTWEELQEIGVNKLGEDCSGPSGWAPACLGESPKCFGGPGGMRATLSSPS